MKVRKWLGSSFNVTSCYFDENGCETSEWNKNEEGVNLFITIPYTASGDYMGSSVEKANRKVLTEMFETYEKEYDELKEKGETSDLYEHPFVYGEDWVERSCGYGYEELVIRGDFLVENLPHGVEEVISNLENYCIICEDTHSEVEVNIIEENWEYYGESELKRAAENSALNIIDCDNAHLENALCEYLSCHGQDMYYTYCEMSGRYPECESAESAIFPDIEKCGDIIGQDFAHGIVWC